MPSRSAGGAIRQIQSLFRRGAVAGLSDGQLLRRFATGRDEASFAALVVRHGPMVLGVCRRVIGDRHEAEDAFQAAFLVLARRAGSIRVDDSLGPWLYTVARRIALRAAASASRRSRAEPADERLIAPDGPEPAERRELLAALDEEVGRLPSMPRAAVVLCVLEGLTHEEAADRLGWPLGTVKGRLARARRLLRDRLARRGFGPTAGSIAVALRPVVPATLMENAASAAIGFAAGRATSAGMVPAAVALARGVLGRMTMTGRMKLAAAVTMAFGVGAGVAGIGVGRLPGTGPLVALADDTPVPGSGRTAKAGTASRDDERATSPPVKSDPIGRLDDEVVRLEGLLREARRQVERIEGEVRERRDRIGEMEAKKSQLTVERAEVAERSAKARPFPRVVALEGRDPRPAAVKEAEGRLWFTPNDPGKSPPPATERKKRVLPDYVVEPPDLISVEVFEALEGRPIKGERLVRPDGKITLGFYGDVSVAGLTIPQIKEKVALHLRKYLTDEALGLVKTGRDKPVAVAPADSPKVAVDVVAYNSKVYYVQGDVAVPGRLNVTGNETVLDAINYAGGLMPTAEPKSIHVVRPAPPGASGEQILPVDFEAIVRRGDASTNYQLFPGDRIIVDRKSEPPVGPQVSARGRRIEERIDAMAKELESLRRELRDGP